MNPLKVAGGLVVLLGAGTYTLQGSARTFVVGALVLVGLSLYLTGMDGDLLAEVTEEQAEHDQRIAALEETVADLQDDGEKEEALTTVETDATADPDVVDAETRIERDVRSAETRIERSTGSDTGV